MTFPLLRLQMIADGYQSPQKEVRYHAGTVSTPQKDMQQLCHCHLLQAFPQLPGGGPDRAAAAAAALQVSLQVLLVLLYRWHRPHGYDGGFQLGSSSRKGILSLQVARGPGQRTISGTGRNYKLYIHASIFYNYFYLKL